VRVALPRCMEGEDALRLRASLAIEMKRESLDDPFGRQTRRKKV
jgi:hypothetical protein